MSLTATPSLVDHEPRRGARWLLLLPVVILIVVVLAHLHRPSTGPTVTVETKPIVEKIVCSGRVLPSGRVSLGPLTRSVVREVRVDEGAHVEAGDILVVLDDAEARAELAQAEAGVSQASARLAQVASVNAKLADEQLARAEAELAKADADLRRTQKLVDNGTLPMTQLEDAERVRARALEARNGARLQVESTRAGGSEARVTAANLAAAKGGRTAAETRLAYSRIVAPAAGVILSRSAEPGDIVEGGKVLMVFARDGEVRIHAQPDERSLGHLSVGQPASVSAEAFPDRSFDARVDWIAPSVDATRGTIDVKLLVPIPPVYVKPDMTVSVNIVTGKKDSAVVLPPEAVRDAVTSRPWVLVRRGKRFERVDIEVGLRSSTAVEILSGVSAGDVVELNATSLKGEKPKIHPWD